MVRVIYCIFILCFLSCGKQHFPDYEDDEIPEREEQEEGVYRGEFVTLNSHYTGRIKASSEFWSRGIQFYAKIFMNNSPPRIRYLQYIHKGSRCPSKSDDLNRDGDVDMFEVIASSGEILIPLDKKLRSQDAGSEWFPLSDKNGSYYYSRSADINELMTDLYSRDRNPGDGVGKLERNEQLNLDQRIVVIYGTTSDPFMPVACAEIHELFE